MEWFGVGLDEIAGAPARCGGHGIFDGVDPGGTVIAVPVEDEGLEIEFLGEGVVVAGDVQESDVEGRQWAAEFLESPGDAGAGLLAEWFL